MRWPVLLTTLWLAIGIPAHAADPDLRAQLCRQAIRDYQAAPPSPEASRRLRAACYGGSGRPARVLPPLAVQGSAASVTPVSPGVPAPALPQGPAVLTQCDAGGCWDHQGLRYSGTGPVYSGPGGTVCVRNGDRIECR